MSTPFEQMTSELLDEMGDVLGPVQHVPLTPERRLLLGLVVDAVGCGDRGYAEERAWFSALDDDPERCFSWPRVAMELGWDAASIARRLKQRWRDRDAGIVTPSPRFVRQGGPRLVPRMRRARRWEAGTGKMVLA